MIHKTVFGCVAVTKDLIDCDGRVDYSRLLTQRVTAEVMIGLDAEVFAVCVNAAKGLAAWGESFEFC